MKTHNKGFTPVGAILIIVALLAVGGGMYYLGKSSKTTPSTTATLDSNNYNKEQNTVETNTTTTQTSTTTTSTQKEKVALPVSKYISPYPSQWPPVIQHSTTAYSCSTISRDVFGSTMELKGTQKTIDGRVFCKYEFSDGGAGHYAGVYTYTTAAVNGKGTDRVDFRVDWGSCGVYGGSTDPEYIQCDTAQKSFFNSMDAAVASQM